MQHCCNLVNNGQLTRHACLKNTAHTIHNTAVNRHCRVQMITTNEFDGPYSQATSLYMLWG